MSLMALQTEQERKLQQTIETVAAEVKRSTKIHGDFQSLHEGYAVFLEEQDELWEEIKRKEILPNQLKKRSGSHRSHGVQTFAVY